MEMMRNPNAMREAMRNQDLAMSHLENHPEGFNALRRMFEDVQEPMMEASQNLGSMNAPNSTNSNPWSVNNANGTPNTAALPNPWGGAPQQTSFGAAAANPFGAGANPFGAGANPFAGFPGAQAGANPFGANPFGGAGLGGMNGLAGMDPAMIQAMMNDPMVQQMMSNPQMIQQV
jgi:ubiquilin